MCFSAQADIAGGLFAGFVGLDALRHARQRSEVALASLPLLFGAHQATEAFVWWGLTDRVPWSVGAAAAWLYLAFAFTVLPVLVPLAVLAVEPDARRRILMKACAGVGAVVAVIYMVAIVTNPISAQIDGHRVVYSNHLGDSGTVNALYVLAGCGALVASSQRRIVAFGAANLAAIAFLLWVDSNAKTSLWCAWAALTSIAIAAHLRLAHRAPGRPSPVPGKVA